MVPKQLVVFADSDVSLRLETVADQAAASSNVVSPVPLRIRRSTVNNSVPYETVRRILGHSSENAIKHYARIDIERLRPYCLIPPPPTGPFRDFLGLRKEG